MTRIQSVSTGVVAMAVCAMLASPAGMAKQTGSYQTSPQQQQTGVPSSHLPSIDSDSSKDPIKERMEEQASKARNSDRYKRIASDTDKLLQLSTELKSDVDKTTKNEMSMDVIRKAAEIEKLAHDVKERMKS